MKILKLIFFPMFLLISLSVQAESKIYSWEDENGVTHFSGRAVSCLEVKEIIIDPQNTFTLQKVNTEEIKAKEGTIDHKGIEINERPYKILISSPIDNSSINNANGEVLFKVKIKPNKKGDQKLQLIIDGKPFAFTTLKSTKVLITLKAMNIDRGTHQIQIKLLDKNKVSIGGSEIIKINLIRPSVLRLHKNNKLII